MNDKLHVPQPRHSTAQPDHQVCVEQNSQAARARVLAPALTYFGLVFAVGLVLGALRVTFMVPRLGIRYAELLEMPLMLAATVLAARYVVRRFSLPSRLPDRALVGAVALMVLVGAEVTLAYLLQGLTPLSYVSSRDPVSGSVYAAVLVLFALMPLIVL